MKGSNNVGCSSFDTHVLEGLFLAKHVFKPFIRIDCSKQIVDNVIGNLRVSNPEGGILERRRIIVHALVCFARDREF